MTRNMYGCTVNGPEGEKIMDNKWLCWWDKLKPLGSYTPFLKSFITEFCFCTYFILKFFTFRNSTVFFFTLIMHLMHAYTLNACNCFVSVKKSIVRPSPPTESGLANLPYRVVATISLPSCSYLLWKAITKVAKCL